MPPLDCTCHNAFYCFAEDSGRTELYENPGYSKYLFPFALIPYLPNSLTPVLPLLAAVVGQAEPVLQPSVQSIYSNIREYCNSFIACLSECFGGFVILLKCVSMASESNQDAVEEESRQLLRAQQVMNHRMQAYTAQQQQLANVYGEQPGGYVNPVSAPNYNTQEGLTYMPTMQSGVSDEDMSPQMPSDFLHDESKAERRLKKLKLILTRSKKSEQKMEKQLEEVTEYVHDEVQKIADSVREANNEETDQISAPYHDVPGPRGPPGIPGLPGLLCAHGGTPARSRRIATQCTRLCLYPVRDFP